MVMKAYAVKVQGRKAEKPGEHPFVQDLMLSLHETVIEENRRQKAKKYSLRDERGETFSLAYWSDYKATEHVLVPAGTPITENNLHWANKQFLASMEDTDFGRWTGEDRERSMERIQQIIQECKEREEAQGDG